MVNYLQGLPALNDISETVASVPGLTQDLRDALLGLDGRPTADAFVTGYLNCSPANNTVFVSGYTFQAIKIGLFVIVDGRAARATSIASGQLWASLPAGIPRPRRIMDIEPLGTNNVPTRAYIETDGSIRTQGTPTTDANLHINAIYAVAPA